MNAESPWATKRPIPFTNVSGETIPAFAAMAITGLVYENGIAFFECDKPGATFVRAYAVNSMFDVPAGLRGTCFRAGDLRVLYDQGTPAAGEGWGPKPGQWSLSLGYPGFAMQGVVDSGHRIAKTFFEPITQVLVKTTAAVAADATTEDYRVYTGAFGSEADAGFTIVPTARNRTGQSMAAEEWAWLHWTNSGWELRCLQNRVYHVNYSGESVGPGATGSATLPDGRGVTFTNWSSDSTIETNDKILIWQDFSDSNFYGIRAGEGNVDRVWYGTANGPISAGGLGTVTKSDSSTPTATNWSDTTPIGAEDKIFIWLDSFDNNHYCIKSGGAPRWFHANFNSGGMRSGDATAAVLTYEALDGGAHPGIISAAVNKYKLSAAGLDECLVVENLAQGNYQIVQVEHLTKEVATEVRYTNTGDRELEYKRQQVTVMYDDEETDWQNIFTAEVREVILHVDYDTATNEAYYEHYTLYTLPDGDVLPTKFVWHTMAVRTVVDGITTNGLGQITVDKETVTVWEAADVSDENLGIVTPVIIPIVTEIGQTGINIYQDTYLAYVIAPVSGPSRTIRVFGAMCADESSAPRSTTLGSLPSEPNQSYDMGAILAATHYH